MWRPRKRLACVPGPSVSPSEAHDQQPYFLQRHDTRTYTRKYTAKCMQMWGAHYQAAVFDDQWPPQHESVRRRVRVSGVACACGGDAVSSQYAPWMHVDSAPLDVAQTPPYASARGFACSLNEAHEGDHGCDAPPHLIAAYAVFPCSAAVCFRWLLYLQDLCYGPCFGGTLYILLL